jgi:hypothetical protein
MSRRKPKGTRTSKGSANFEVGRCKPPRHSRWKPGKSGNPNGRPKGAKGKHKLQDAILQKARETFLEEGKRKITIREGDKVVTMEAYQIAVRSTFVAAAKGSAMAQRTVIQTMMAAEAEISQVTREAFASAVAYKADCRRERARCLAQGLPEPAFFPHPDDIKCDWETLTVAFEGPMTVEQYEAVNQLLMQRDEWEEDFRFIRQCWEENGRQEASRFLAIQSQLNYDKANWSLPERLRKPLKGRFSSEHMIESVEWFCGEDASNQATELRRLVRKVREIDEDS